MKILSFDIFLLLYLICGRNETMTPTLSVIDLLNCFLLPRRKIEYSPFFYNRYNYTSFNDIIFDTGFSAL